MFKNFFSLIVIIAAALGLMLTKPSVNDFAQWYIEEAEMSSPLDGLLQEVIVNRTDTHDYVVIETFCYEERNFVGIANHILGGRQVTELIESTTEALEKAVAEAKDHVEIK